MGIFKSVSKFLNIFGNKSQMTHNKFEERALQLIRKNILQVQVLRFRIREVFK